MNRPAMSLESYNNQNNNSRHNTKTTRVLLCQRAIAMAVALANAMAVACASEPTIWQVQARARVQRWEGRLEVRSKRRRPRWRVRVEAAVAQVGVVWRARLRQSWWARQLLQELAQVGVQVRA